VDSGLTGTLPSQEMRGTDATTGKPLAGIAHLKQSIRDILTTPIGSRVLRRDYGSRLFDLIDAPSNESTIMDIYAATIEALLTWEPRIAPQTVKVAAITPGQILLDLTALYIPEGRIITLNGIAIS
jgi:phage baseplate assembly protein W